MAGPDAERLSLKEAVARKRRNDRVRNDELNHLRELMRARWLKQEEEGSSQAPSSGLSGLSTLSSTLRLDAGPGSARNRTMSEIARIESQMAQHWLGRGQTPAASGTRIAGARLAQAIDRDLSQSMHLRARSKAAPALPIDVVAEEAQSTLQALSGALTDPLLAQAAQAFAQGQDEAAERALRQLMVQAPQSLSARVAAMALLDFFHARGEFESFDEFAAEFAERFGTPVPRWPSEAAASSDPSEQPPAAPVPFDIWVCPLFLDGQAVATLEQALAGPHSVKWLDWTGLLSADLPAAEALLEQVQGLRRRVLQLHFVGAAVLRRRLKASTPSGRSENDAVWWQLRLALLCLMRRRDEFDLAALDYCVTYGVLPPEWEQPLCAYAAADSLPDAAAPAPVPSARATSAQTHQPSAATAAEPLAWPGLPLPLPGAPNGFDHTRLADWPAALTLIEQAAPALTGSLGAGHVQVWNALDQALAQHPPGSPFVLDCRALLRVDLPAASALLQCLLAARQRSVVVELHGLSRLLAAYFHTVGLDEVATLRLRQY
ncbi:Tfp pilus assembly protein FimV [Serpentinimonas raichei]|uniref:Tfp pilus assembly protein FimV n=1 Tax=Serpentinimonas raichei TaxID=1458425 RepID=A0A060NSL8_9BURK|nr:Tfp pilus assembly protein FimV [Serpentinimonas raichei]